MKGAKKERLCTETATGLSLSDMRYSASSSGRTAKVAVIAEEGFPLPRLGRAAMTKR